MKNFRGNILDRQFPVEFDPSSGQYSYNYADVTPNISSKLKNLKYYRKSSKDLAEIEADLAAYLKKEGPAAPPVKGNITKAAEEQAAKKEEAFTAFEAIQAKEKSGKNLTEYNKELRENAKQEVTKQLRTKKVEYAKQQQEDIYATYNEKLARGEAVNINANTKRAKLSLEDKNRFDELSKLMDAANYLEELDKKEKSGVALTPGEKTKQTQEATLIDGFTLPNEEIQALVTLPRNINEKGEYNAAKATYTQLINLNTEDLSLQQRKNLAKATNLMETYQAAHPNTMVKAAEQQVLKEIELKRKELQTINAKPKPLSPENTESRARLQAEINAHNAAYQASRPAFANVENATLQENELEQMPATRELSDEAFQARRNKAQKVLNYFTGSTAPPSPSAEQAALRNNAQRIKNAFAKLNNTSAKASNKNAARNTIKKSNFLNKARKLSIVTEGGRRTRKAKKSKRKTYKHKH